MRIAFQGAAIAALTLTTVGCSSNPIAGEWEGTCSTAEHQVDFVLSDFDTDRIGFVNDVDGETEALMHSMTATIAGAAFAGTGEFLRCLEPDGCVFPDPEMGAKPKDWFRDDIKFSGEDGIIYRMTLDGTLEDRKEISGPCFFINLWGTYEGTRSESQWVNEHKTED